MKKLFQIVQDRFNAEIALSNLRKEFNAEEKKLLDQIQELSRLEKISDTGLDISRVQLAESIISIKGDPYGNTSEIKMGHRTIAKCAIIDIANGCQHLKTRYYGNKEYSGYYQRCDCEYGMGPKHGGICDSIQLISDVRSRELTDDEKDACIYYINNYNLVKEAKKLTTEAQKA